MGSPQQPHVRKVKGRVVQAGRGAPKVAQSNSGQKGRAAASGLGNMAADIDDNTLVIAANIDRELTEPNSPHMIPRIRAKLHEAVDLLSQGTQDPQHLALLDSVRKDTDAEEGMGRNSAKLASLSDELGYHRLSASIREI